MITKKRLNRNAALLAAVFALTAIVGCAGGGKPSDSNSDAPPKKDVTLTFVSSQGWVDKGKVPGQEKIDTELIEAFTAETGIKIDMQIIPDDQYANVLKTKLASGEAPDIFMVGAGTGANNYLPDKFFADLSNEAWVSKYVPYAKAGTTIDGKVSGLMTWAVDGWGLLYNTEIFETYNLSVPATFEEFVEMLEVLKNNDITPIYQVGKEAWHWGTWLSQLGPYAARLHPGLYDDLNANEVKFADVEELETFLIQLKELYDKGYFGSNSISNVWDSAYAAMGEGKAAMFLAYTSYQNEIAAQYPESRADQWKMFPIPLAGNDMFSHSAGGTMRVANKNSEHLDSVKQYFDFLTRPDNLQKFYDARTDLLSTPSFEGVEAVPTEAGKAFVENAPGGEGIDMTYGIKYWDDTLVGKYIQDMLLGGITPANVLESIDRDRARLFAAEAQ